MKSNAIESFVPRLIRLTLILLAMAIIPLFLLVGCQSRLIYFPRPYGATAAVDWQRETAGKIIDYRTAQGNQRAFLQGNLKTPRNLWIVCGGNGSVALDWQDWITAHAPKQDAWLLVDYPGYGDSEGSPSPRTIRENLKTAVPLAWKEAGLAGDPDPSRLRFFGHSLGAAASLLAATDFKIQRGVILTPFTSTMDMAKHMTGLPIGPFVTHRFDNAARLKELAERGQGQVIIVHGDDDEAIPISMGRKLAADRKDVARLIEIPGGRHNTIPETHTRELAEALRETGE